MSTAVEHVAVRPSWACGACGEPWPCAPAKVHLAEKYSGEHVGQLLVRLGQWMWDAFHDGLLRTTIQCGQPVPPELRERFLDWVTLPLISGASPTTTQ